MTMLLLSPRHTSDSAALWRAALSTEWSVERLQSYRLPEWLQSEEVVLYGEGLFVQAIAHQLGISLIEPTLDWLITLPEDYLLRNIEYLTLSEARNINLPAFIKPADGKLFQAKVYSNNKQLPDDESQSDSTPVLVAEPVEWEIEFRCFILNDQVVTLSPYVRNGELAVNDADEWLASDKEFEEAHAFCQKLLMDSEISKPPAFVIDVGVIKGKGWAVIEGNPAWASGIYGCNPAQVLTVVQRCCIPECSITPEDRKWIINRIA